MEAANSVSASLDANENNTTLNAVAFIRPLMFQAGIGISVVSSAAGFIDISKINDERASALMRASSRRHAFIGMEKHNSDSSTIFTTLISDVRCSRTNTFSCCGVISSPSTETFDGAFAAHPSRVDATMHIAAARDLHSNRVSLPAPQEPLVPASVQVFFVRSTVPDCKPGFGVVSHSSDRKSSDEMISDPSQCYG